jgi:Plasmid pRiA4b ORF-3-like protein
MRNKGRSFTFHGMASDTSPRPAVRRGRKPKPRLLELTITLADIEPSIWRRVRVPDTYTLHQLHRVIQLLFGWLDDHLYGFDVGERRFEQPMEHAEDEDSTAVRLSDLQLSKNARLAYAYDFGDDWVHEIVVDDIHIVTLIDEHDERLLPALSSGERAGPPEDCGGPFGYAEMLEALRDPSHPEHEQYRQWSHGYDPELFDLRMVRNNLTLAAAWGAI